MRFSSTVGINTLYSNILIYLSKISIEEIILVSTKKFEVCFLAISQLLLGQIQKVRSVLRISKLSLLLKLGQVEAEIIEVKDIRSHFKFTHF